MEVVFGVIVFALFVWFLFSYINSCPHDWNIYREYERTRKSDGSPIGIVVVKKCSYCHKLKSEEEKI